MNSLGFRLEFMGRGYGCGRRLAWRYFIWNYFHAVHFRVLTGVLLSPAEVQLQLAVAVEKERSASQQTLDATSRLVAVETAVSSLRQERARIQAALEAEQARAALLEETMHR